VGDRLTGEKVRIQGDANQALPPEMCPEVEVVLAAHERPHISNLHEVFLHTENLLDSASQQKWLLD